jgi:hypothetical protein
VASASASIVAPDGANLVFVTGAPGSRWSAIAHALTYADPVNISDTDASRVYASDSGATHFGSYFGPGMGHGEKFDRLSELSKEHVSAELAAAYHSPGGTLLLKSHLFARHLDVLREMFPRSRVLLVYRNDDGCLKWWVEAGGFSISFPDYSWYGELENMREQIKVDNTAIIRFAERHSLTLRRYDDLDQVAAGLNLAFSEERARWMSRLPVEREHGFGQRDPAAAEVLRLVHQQAALADLAWV